VYRLYPLVTRATPVDSFVRIPRLHTLLVGVSCTVPFPLLCLHHINHFAFISFAPIPQSPYHVFLGVDV
jgi:hypothetical protein